MDSSLPNEKHKASPLVVSETHNGDRDLGHDPLNVGSTIYDHNDMHRLGKKQVFQRTFGFWAAFGFTNIYIATWEYLLVSVYSSLVNGGFGGLVYEYIGTTICYTSIVLSLAEMSSMAPTSGGQYHWVSEFAHPSIQRYLSYATGWLSALGWLTGAASGSYIMSTIIQAMINVYLPDVTLNNWQTTLIMIGWMLVFVVINTLGARLLPTIQIFSLIGHISGWIITVVALWVMVTPKNSAHEVFTSVVNSGGWSNTGLSCLIGTSGILYAQLGPDAAVHIAEEVGDAAWVLPRCIVWGYLLNGVLGFVMLVTMLFTMGDLQTALAADSPFETAFTNTGSTSMNLVLILILGLLIAAGNISAVTTTSRETWAFARDRGLPFSSFMSVVSRRFNAPLNAIYVTTFFCIVLCLIQLGSTVAFNIIISLQLVSFLLCYILSIGSVLYRKLFPSKFGNKPLPPARFSLGVFSIPINIFALVYSTLALALSCFPVSVPVDASNANWAPAILGAVIVIAAISYMVQGRKHYRGPVVFVEGRRGEAFDTVYGEEAHFQGTGKE